MQHQFKTALALLAFAAPFGAQSLLEKLTWPLVDGTERFGSEIAVDGDLAAVSAPQAGGYQGGVATYKRDGDSWIQEALIVPSDGVLDDRFGARSTWTATASSSVLRGTTRRGGRTARRTSIAGSSPAWARAPS